MRSFFGLRSNSNVTTVDDNDEVQLCPKCSFPNYDTARECLDCGYPLQDENILWLRASQVKKCENPECGCYLSVKERKCKKCGYSFDKPESSSRKPTKYVKICPNCGTKMPPNAPRCTCGFSLRDEEAVLEEETLPISVCLENVHTGKKTFCSFTSESSMLFGRSYTIYEHFDDESDSLVSREHFVISYRDGVLWLTDKSRHGTYIGGARLEKEFAIKLPNETVIALGEPSGNDPLGACFKVTYEHAD